MKQTKLSILDDIARHISKKEAMQIYESKINKKYKSKKYFVEEDEDINNLLSNKKYDTVEFYLSNNDILECIQNITLDEMVYDFLIPNNIAYKVDKTGIYIFAANSLEEETVRDFLSECGYYDDEIDNFYIN